MYHLFFNIAWNFDVLGFRDLVFIPLNWPLLVLDAVDPDRGIGEVDFSAEVDTFFVWK